MIQRLLSGRNVNALGFGAMCLSHAYGVIPTPQAGREVLAAALDLGADHIDTAALYGNGRNETLVGETLKGLRDRVFLASKCGVSTPEGMRDINGRPERLRATCEASLKRLRTDHIDLYYLHRWDKSIPIEESVGALGELAREGKIGGIGLSEVSAATLKKAHREHPVAALQTEYSLWTRNPEIAVLEACKDLGVAFVAFSPVGRGFLAGGVRDNRFAEGDFRRTMPRFNDDEAFARNLKWFAAFEALARRAGVTPAQLSLAWVLSRGDHVHVIPGTTRIDHLRENMETPVVAADVLAEAEDIVSARNVAGARYSAASQAEVDTEEFEAA
jgi:aryl-alcohol dehydrogenase-like predicted oxidoreductase